MFITVITEVSRVEDDYKPVDISDTYECKNYSLVPRGAGTLDLILDDDRKTISLNQANTELYIMNDSGRTIDSYKWRQERDVPQTDEEAASQRVQLNEVARHDFAELLDAAEDVLKFEIEQKLPMSTGHGRLLKVIEHVDPNGYAEIDALFAKNEGA